MRTCASRWTRTSSSSQWRSSWPAAPPKRCRMERISTGNEQADRILNGGFPQNSIHLIMGEPGTGKTIFAEQLVFANAGGERPLLYITTLSEPLAKFITYLQGYTFADPGRLGTEVIYEDLGAELGEHPEKLGERVLAL